VMREMYDGYARKIELYTRSVRGNQEKEEGSWENKENVEARKSTKKRSKRSKEKMAEGHKHGERKYWEEFLNSSLGMEV
jgi:hypothetical protein